MSAPQTPQTPQTPRTPQGSPRALLTVERRPPSGDWQWALTLLPAFPLLLLVLRVWYLARQDLQTVLLVLQSAGALGLIAALLISMVWAVPALLLVLRMLHLLQLVSLQGAGEPAARSWLARVGARTPVWVSVPAAGVAALSWQLRYLPSLLMLVLVITGLELRVRLRLRSRRRSALVARAWTVLSVLVVAIAAAWFWPSAYRAAAHHGDAVTAALLVVPLLVAPVLPGPLPARAARWLLPALATVVAVAVPVVLGQRYLEAPVLPRVAVRVQTTADAAGQVLRGSLVSVDDRFVTVLDARGRVHVVPNTDVTAEVLCSAGPEPPTTPSAVHGWQVEQSVLSWAGPTPAERVVPVECRGL